MNISPNVDIGASFERIKKGLQRSENFWQDEQDQPLVVDRLRRAYANLYAVIVVELEYVEKGEITPSPLADDKAYDRMQDNKELTDRMDKDLDTASERLHSNQNHD